MKADKLTWQDVRKLVRIADYILDNYRDNHGVLVDERTYYSEVLNRYIKGYEEEI